MTFSSKLPLDVIFDFWKIENTTGLIVSCFAFCLFGIGHEYLKSLQIRFAKQKFNFFTKPQTTDRIDVSDNDTSVEAQSRCGVITNEQNPNNHIKKECKETEKNSNCDFNFILKHFLDAMAHCALLAWSYILMFSVMTKNPAIVTSAVGGCSIGYFFFHGKGRKKSTINYNEEELKYLSEEMKETAV